MPKKKKKNKIEIKDKTKEFLSKTPWFLARHAFLSFLVFFFLVLIISGLLFYQQLWRVQRREVEVEIEQVQINEKQYSQFLGNYQERQIRYKEAEEEQYPDIFFQR